jgi:hypothetical protein
MPLQSIKGGTWLPNRPPHLNANLATVQLALGVTAYRAGCVIQAPRSGNVTKIGFLCDATSPSSAIVEARMETIDATTGFPTGTLLHSTAYGSVSLSAGTQWYTATLQSPETVTQGAMFAIVFRFTTGSLTNANIHAVSSASCPQEFPYVVGNTGSWLKYQHAPICALEYSLSGYEVVQGAWPVKAVANTSFNNSGTNQRGLRVKLPFPAQVVGAWVWADLDGDAALKLYNNVTPSSPAELASVSIDKDYRYGTTYGRQVYYFNNPVVLNQDAEYFLTLNPSSGTSVILNEVEVNAAALLDGMDGGQNLHLVTRATSGAFTATTTKRPMMGLILDQFPGNLGYFDVTTFGAIGDGTADDTAEIQAAINAAASAGEGSTVFLPLGTYLCEGLDIAGHHQRFMGDGTLKLKNASTAFQVLKVSGNYNSVSGVRVDGNRSGAPTGRAFGMYVTGNYNHVRDVRVFNTRAAGALDAGVGIYAGGEQNLVEQAAVEDAGGPAFSNAGNYNRYQDCTASNWSEVAFYHSASPIDRLDIDGGYFEPGDASITKNCILFEATSGAAAMVVIRNTIVDWKDDFEQSGSPSIAKFAQVDWLILDNCLFKHKQNLVDVEIGATVKRAHLDHTFLSRQLKLVSLYTEAVILLDDVQIGSDALWNGGVQPPNAVLGVGGSQFVARSSQFLGYTAAALEVVLNLSSATSFVHFEASDCAFHSYNTGVTTYEVTTSGTGAVNASRKILWLNNRSSNWGGSASQYSISDGEQRTLFTTRDWSKRVYQGTASPAGSTVTWQNGDIVMRETPTSGGTIGWVKTSSGWKTFGTIT